MAILNLIEKVIGKIFLKLIPNHLFVKKVNYSREQNWNSLKKMFKHIDNDVYIQHPYLIKNPQYISIGKSFGSLYNLRLEAWDEYEGVKYKPEIIIGDNVKLNTDCHIGCINKVVIGNNVLMASRIFISDHSHGEISKETLMIVPINRKLYSKGPVVIEDDVWIGEGVCILSGVRIGKSSVIGANAVVTKDVPPYSVVGGIPAMVIRSFQ